MKTYLTVISLLFIASGVAYYNATKPHTATIDSKHWQCTGTYALGIEAKCSQYTRVDK